MTNCAFIDYFVRRLKQFNQRICKKITYIRIRKFKIQRIQYFFISIKAQLLTISNIIPYILETNRTSSSLKKKTLREEKKEEKGNVKEMEKRRRRKREKRKRN